ncbi:MAG TPA: hypothetical protein VGG40_06790 [Solirubrobacterales bacterium]|jgi:hypothetical protein
MEILASRILLHPTDLDRSLRFYEQALGLAVYREWGTGRCRPPQLGRPATCDD